MATPSSQKKQDKKPKVVNRFETEHTGVLGHLEQAGKEIAAVPKDIAVDFKNTAVDSFVGALYGVSATEVAQKREREQNKNFTPMDWAKLDAAHKRGDMMAVQHINEEMGKKAQQKQEFAARFKQRKSEEERVQHQIKQEKAQREKEEEEEEMRKKQEEEQRKQQEAQQMAGAGAGKTKGRLGAPRKKASTDVGTNFEAGQGKTGK